MASDTKRFDFRLAVRERERAIRLIEAMLNHSARSGEDIERETLDELRALVTCWGELRTVALPESGSPSGQSLVNSDHGGG
jgi:hypothetical protein